MSTKKNTFTASTYDMSDRELLIRIDERQQQIQQDVKFMKKSLSRKVSFDDDYREMKHKVNKMWELKNKAMVYITLISAVLGIGFKFLYDAVMKRLGIE